MGYCTEWGLESWGQGPVRRKFGGIRKLILKFRGIILMFLKERKKRKNEMKNALTAKRGKEDAVFTSKG